MSRRKTEQKHDDDYFQFHYTWRSCFIHYSQLLLRSHVSFQSKCKIKRTHLFSQLLQGKKVPNYFTYLFYFSFMSENLISLMFFVAAQIFSLLPLRQQYQHSDISIRQFQLLIQVSFNIHFPLFTVLCFYIYIFNNLF